MPQDTTPRLRVAGHKHQGSVSSKAPQLRTPGCQHHPKWDPSVICPPGYLFNPAIAPSVGTRLLPKWPTRTAFSLPSLAGPLPTFQPQSAQRRLLGNRLWASRWRSGAPELWDSQSGRVSSGQGARPWLNAKRGPKEATEPCDESVSLRCHYGRQTVKGRVFASGCRSSDHRPRPDGVSS